MHEDPSQTLVERLVAEAKGIPADAFTTIKAGKLPQELKSIGLVPDELKAFLVLEKKKTDKLQELVRKVESEINPITGDDAKERIAAIIDLYVPRVRCALIEARFAGELFWNQLAAAFPASKGPFGVAEGWLVFEQPMNAFFSIHSAVAGFGSLHDVDCGNPRCPIHGKDK